MEMTLKEIARILGGTVIGRDDVFIKNIMSIEEANEGDLTFIANKKYLKKMKLTQASAILAPPQTIAEGKNLIIVADPYASMGKLLLIFFPVEHGYKGISKDAYIEEGAIVSPEANVFPGHSLAGEQKSKRELLSIQEFTLDVTPQSAKTL